MLQRLAAMERLFKGETLGGRLRVGASVTIGNHLLPPLLGGFMARVEIPRPEVTIANTAQLCRMVVGFDIDAAFVEGATHGAPLEVTPLWRDRLVVIAPPGHPLAAGRVRRFRNWPGRPGFCANRRRAPANSFRCVWSRPCPLGVWVWNSAATSRSSTRWAAGLGLGFLSEFAVADALAAGRVALVALDAEHARSLDLVVAPGKYQSPLLRRFLDFCREWSPDR
jgi:DNA-binding transcriptional LysR family regulator